MEEKKRSEALKRMFILIASFLVDRRRRFWRSVHVCSWRARFDGFCKVNITHC